MSLKDWLVIETPFFLVSNTFSYISYLGLYRKEKASWAPPYMNSSFTSCSWLVMWGVLYSSYCCSSTTSINGYCEPNKSFLPSVVFFWVFYHKDRKKLRFTERKQYMFKEKLVEEEKEWGMERQMSWNVFQTLGE